MISDNSIFKQKMNEIIKKEKESQENIKRIIDNYKQIAGKNSEYLKRINKIFQNEDLDESYLEGNTLIDSYESTSKLKTTNKNVSLLNKTANLLAIDRSKVRKKIKSIEKSKNNKNTIVNDSFHYNSNISKIAKKTYLMNNNLISSDNVPLFKEESNFYSSNISLANKIENTFDVKINDNFNLVSQNNKEEYKKANETIIIEPEDYQIKEEESMRLIEKVDNDFPTVLKASDDDNNNHLNSDKFDLKINQNDNNYNISNKALVDNNKNNYPHETNQMKQDNKVEKLNHFDNNNNTSDDKNQNLIEDLSNTENLIKNEKVIDENNNLVNNHFSHEDNYNNNDKFNILESYTTNDKDQLFYESNNNNIEQVNKNIDKDEYVIKNNNFQNEKKITPRGRESNLSNSTNYKLKNELYLIELENKNLNKKLNSFNNSINKSKSKSKSKEKTIKPKENTLNQTKKEITSEIIFNNMEEDLFGNIIDQIIEGKCYLYNNKICFSCKEILFEGKTTFYCKKMH